MPMIVLSIIIIILAAIWSGQLNTNGSCDVEIAFEYLHILFIDIITVCNNLRFAHRVFLRVSRDSL